MLWVAFLMYWVRYWGKNSLTSCVMDCVEVNEGEELHYVTWGGGGWGDALKRDAGLVRLEVSRGLISVTGARDYGVVYEANGVVDKAATIALRAIAKASRAPLNVFEFGPGIEKLRETCLEDTGLPAPKQPVWRGRQSDRIAAE
jgi:N-methylhydantoinase B